MRFFASCPLGVADLLAAELKQCGATQVREFRLGAEFEGTLETAYRACLWSRIASRIFLPLATFAADTPKALYDGVAAIDWQVHLRPDQTLAVDFAGASSGIEHTHFGALRTKDAIVDQFRERTGERPSVDVEQPDVRINVRLDRERATLSIDLSGDSLHRRGYRARGVAAPLKENLAAAILLRCGWPAIAREGGVLVDPMCGSGTFLIEAAYMACEIAPGILRERFGFSNWLGHEDGLWQRLRAEARARANRSGVPVLRGFDQDPAAVRAALENLERADLKGIVHVERRELASLTSEGSSKGLLITNPPYGQRLGEIEALRGLYAALGERLRTQFEGWQAAVFTGNPPLARELGIEARRTHTLFNGQIECRLLRFEVRSERYHSLIANERQSRSQEAAAQARAELRARPGAQMFANRLQKNLAQAQAWARKNDVDCYRVYDADMPEYAFAIDLYGDGAGQQWACVQEYAPPAKVNPAGANARRAEALAVIPEVLGLPRERIFERTREPQRGTRQYEKMAAEREFHVVREAPHRFLVNFDDYLDTGLFLDHRPTRRKLAELAAGRRFLNLFAYTGTATVHAVGGGAVSSTTVDMSRTYLDWAKRNLALNELAGPKHDFVQANCLTWLNEQAQAAAHCYDLMFIDPPTHSRSKRMTHDFDVQRDHVRLLELAASLLAPDGLIVFSNNYTRFKLDTEALSAFAIEDWTRASLPKDFARSPRIHCCYLLRRASSA